MFKASLKKSNRVALSASLLIALCVAANAAVSVTTVRFSLDRAIDGAAAPFVLAASKGLFRTENLNVMMNAGTTSQDAIARVASGAVDIALADINALFRYRDKEDAVPVKAVFVLYDKARARAAASPPSRTSPENQSDLSMAIW